MAKIRTTLLLIALSSIRAFAEDCILTPPIIEKIAAGVSHSRIAIDEKQSVAFKSEAFKNLYFVASRISFKHNKLEPVIGVWAVSDLSNGLVFGANIDAVLATSFPDGRNAGPRVKTEDHGYRQVFQCFRQHFKVSAGVFQRSVPGEKK